MPQANRFFPQILGLHHMFFHCLHAKSSSDNAHPRQGPILGLLLRLNGMSQADIVREMDVSAATVAVSLARLEKLGLITREKNLQNQRANILRLTEKGTREALEMQRLMDEIGRTALEGFTDAEVGQMEAYCARMVQNMRQRYKMKECGEKHAPHGEAFAEIRVDGPGDRGASGRTGGL